MGRRLQEFTLYNLLSHSRPEHHGGIRILWADPKVQYLILFQGRDESEKAILTVGPELDYTSLEEITEVEVDGMTASAFVKSRHFSKFDSPRKKILDRLSNAGRELSRNPFEGLFGVGVESSRNQDDDEGLPSLPMEAALAADEPSVADEVEEVGNDRDDVFGEISMSSGSDSLSVVSPPASALDKATTDEAWAEIKRREEQLENLRQELLAREGFITESENRLLEISQQHHEEQEELNHKLESLKKWEMELGEKERRLARLEAASK